MLLHQSKIKIMLHQHLCLLTGYIFRIDFVICNDYKAGDLLVDLYIIIVLLLLLVVGWSLNGFLRWLQYLIKSLDTHSGGITSNSTLPYWWINHFHEQLNFEDMAVFHFAAWPESENCWILISTQGHQYPGALPGWVCLLAVSSVPSQPLAPRAVSATISPGQESTDLLPDAWVDE